MLKRLLTGLVLLALTLTLLPGINVRAAETKTDEEIIAASMVYLNMKEGNCDSVNADDNGAVSIGMIQWHGPRALTLLQRLIALIPEFSLETLGEEFYNEIVNAKPEDWNKRVVNEEEAAKLVILLGTEESKQLQFDIAREDLQGYITRGRSRGMSTAALLFYYMDMENQYGSGGANSLLIRARRTSGLENFPSLYDLHSALLDTPDSYVQNYINRRKSTYNYVVKTLLWEEQPYVISYDAGGGEGTMRTQPLFTDGTVTLRTNTFLRPGYSFAGWQLRRASDNCWYVSGVGWCSESTISAKSLTKTVFTQSQSFGTTAAWLTNAAHAETFVFTAVWQPVNYRLELYANYSGCNYILGSDLTHKLNESYIKTAGELTAVRDTAQTYNGSNSLKITSKTAGTADDEVSLVTSLSGNAVQDQYFADIKTLCFSFWARASVSDAKVKVYWQYDTANAQELILSTEWTKYTLTLQKTVNCGRELKLNLRTAGSVWLSQLQLQEGTEATEFVTESSGEYRVLELTYDSLCGTLPVPVRKGYSFLGWYTAATGGWQFTDRTPVRLGHRCAYAQWERDWDCSLDGHDWSVADTTAPGCTEPGYQNLVCRRCGTTQRTVSTAPTGHDFGAWIIELEPTCTQSGMKYRSCKTCGITATQSLDTVSHTPGATVVKKEPSCTGAGTAETVCAVCGQPLSEEIVPATGHLWSAWTVVEQSDGIHDGLKKHSCVICNEEETLAIPGSAHEHSYLKRVIPPTCTLQGRTQYICSTCGYEYISDVTAATDHSWDAGVITALPTVWHEGLKTFTCTACAQTKTQTIAPLDSCDGGESCPAQKFKDIPPTTNWAHTGIDYVVNAGLFAGISPDLFSPDGTMTRAMLVSVLYRLAGSPQTDAVAAFNDVPEGQWYTKAVAWAAQCRLVVGVGDGSFNPNGNVTREQIAVFMLHFAAYQGQSVAQTAVLESFPDNGSIALYARYAVAWANKAGLLSGKLNGDTILLAPGGIATRAEVASILLRFSKSTG